MSSDLISIVEVLQFNNYVSVVIATAVIYDYIITFPKEIKYIWNRSWTFVSALFILIRYVGLPVVLIFGFYGSTFIPGPTLVSTVLFLIAVWGFIIFLAAADLVMILRLYAMYNQSKIVLGVLLVIYAVTITLYAISAAYYNNLHTLIMTTPQVLEMSFCNPTYNTTYTALGVYKIIPRRILVCLMFTLSIYRVCMESYQTYKVTKQWKSNQYLNHLVKEGVFYFLIHLLYSLDFGQNVLGYVMDMFSFILAFSVSPRFIINVRELHLHNLLYGRDIGIDSGFGLSSRDVGVSSIGFPGSRPGSLGFAGGDIELQLVGSESDSKH